MDNLKPIPEEYREVFRKLRDDILTLHALWDCFKQLFASEKENVDLLNKAAPGMAWMIERCFMDIAIVRLTRLSDPAVQGEKKFENLSIERLRPLGSFDSALQAKFDKARERMVKAKKKIKVHRNRRIGHMELKTALGAHKLPKLTIAMIDAALEAVRDVMNSIEEHFVGGPMVYEFAGVQGDASNLLACLADGLAMRALAREQRKMSETKIRTTLMEMRWRNRPRRSKVIHHRSGN